MPTERRTVGENGHGEGDHMLAGLGRRPTELYTDDERRGLISSMIRPTAIDAVAIASKLLT